jgi:hypothetical protein
MVKAKLSSCEIDFILYIALSQDVSGTIESVYYKDVCNAIGISIQSFYDILDSLRDKQLITWSKPNRADVKVTLLGNDFSNKRFKDGYLKVAATNFNNAKFKAMKAGAKLLYLYMQRFVQGKHMLVQNFYDEFCRIFQVTRKSLQLYIKELKDNYFLFISKKRNKSYNYEMTMKNSSVLLYKEHEIPREKGLYIKNVKDLIERNFKKRIPKENPDKVTRDIANLADTKRAEKHPDFVSLIVTAISDSINHQRQEGKKEPILNAALVNSCLGNVLEQKLIRKYGL